MANSAELGVFRSRITENTGHLLSPILASERSQILEKCWGCIQFGRRILTALYSKLAGVGWWVQREYSWRIITMYAGSILADKFVSE